MVLVSWALELDLSSGLLIPLLSSPLRPEKVTPTLTHLLLKKTPMGDEILPGDKVDQAIPTCRRHSVGKLLHSKVYLT